MTWLAGPHNNDLITYVAVYVMFHFFTATTESVRRPSSEGTVTFDELVKRFESLRVPKHVPDFYLEKG